MQLHRVAANGLPAQAIEIFNAESDIAAVETTSLEIPQEAAEITVEVGAAEPADALIGVGAWVEIPSALLCVGREGIGLAPEACSIDLLASVDAAQGDQQHELRSLCDLNP